MSSDPIVKVDSAEAETGKMGQKNLAAGQSVALRLWVDEEAGEPKRATTRDYETVGYVLSGRAELHIGTQMTQLAMGDSWVVPKGASHSYKILEHFTALEATSPPAQSVDAKAK